MSNQGFSYNEKSQQIESMEPAGIQINALDTCVQCECKPECYDQGTVPQYLNPNCV
jgi:hypothetical protein